MQVKPKLGDIVFIVRQNDSRRGREKLPVRVSEEQVVKVGRKYAYLEGDRKFDYKTGESFHSCSTIRANGRGFDVYSCEQEYLQKLYGASELERLKDRLNGNYRFPSLKPQTVFEIHKVLDEAGE